ncbi:hypothetical protein ACOT81_19715 [Streptomyces sp. WI04-05B]|uniref:hypothetical protein n=1 Tax=Streptomyces TaxID=1883 RepID=UPI0029AD76ED|nr:MULTISPECIES: hypothetical protein [unclassified Streptomyces]MDX2548840.1 hypothetical protein [Streptomyces sp. WI04-05B]MDX2590461.1 hypothetical protein [Streptomyces sp. WI04-05A]MDX3753775.1 hypothetical protein [Streptomyces sp. AK08-02]
MNLIRNRSRRTTTAALALLTVAALGTAGATASNAATKAAAPQTKVIASSVLGSDYKITLTAKRSPEDQYAATVELQVYTQSGGAWKQSDLVTVGDVDGWFWFPLTGKGAVCEFSTASTEPAPLDVSLLITPSIGCSEPTHYVVKQGRVYG